MAVLTSMSLRVSLQWVWTGESITNITLKNDGQIDKWGPASCCSICGLYTANDGSKPCIAFTLVRPNNTIPAVNFSLPPCLPALPALHDLHVHLHIHVLDICMQLLCRRCMAPLTACQQEEQVGFCHHGTTQMC